MAEGRVSPVPPSVVRVTRASARVHPYISIVTVAAAVSKARTFQECVLRPRAVLVYVLLKGVR